MKPTIKFHPILFSTMMVQAIEAGTKEITRRIVNPQPTDLAHGKIEYMGRERTRTSFMCECKYNVGDILWVRETFTEWPKGSYQYRANTVRGEELGPWKPSIFMPKEACRLFLRVTKIRMERLQDISEIDAVREGIKIIHSEGNMLKVFQNYLKKEKIGTTNPIRSFLSLWDSINGKKWPARSNPYVWVIEFEVIDKPEGWLKD